MESNNGKYELNIKGKTLCQTDLLSCGVISHKNSHHLSPFSTHTKKKKRWREQNYDHNNIMLSLGLQQKAVLIFCSSDILPHWWETPQTNKHLATVYAKALILIP